MAEPVPQHSPQHLDEMLKSKQPPLVVDVRNAPEIDAEGTIDGALRIPMNELPARLGELPQDRAIVCVCKVGMRSFNAAAFLRQRGLDAGSLAGGMNAWLGANLPVRR